jgi:uncharacterized protein with GYD domain
MALCIEVVRATLEAMGGEVVATGYMLGDYGFVLLAEVPGNTTATGHRAGVGRWRVRGFEQQNFSAARVEGRARRIPLSS